MIRRVLFGFCVLCSLGRESNAAAPTVEAVAPAVGQRGTEFTLTFTGARLADPQELLLYAPGVTCTKIVAKSENEVTATLKATSDCRLGEYPVRLRTKGGASELRVFRITPIPVVAEHEPNDSPKQAQVVPANVSVAGVIEAGGSDYYAIALKKGQRLAAEVEAVRLGGELTDAVLTVYGPDGTALATVDDAPLFRQDPFLTLVAPADGVYTVQVRESGLGGGDSSRYVLHVGTFSRPAAVFPAGGQAGTSVAVKLMGDAAGERTQTIALPTSDGFEFYPTDGTISAPTPNPFRVSPFPNVLEVEPNDDPKLAGVTAAWPVAFNGIIGTPGDVDHYRFRAVKGDVIDVAVFAYRIGSPLDSVVTVFGPTGEVVGGNDDDETHDSRVRVTIPADGEYLVQVRDKRKNGGPGFVYRVELDRPRAGLALFMPTPTRKSQAGQVIAVPRGNRVTAFLAVRRDGFYGPVTITPGELPRGVRLVGEEIPAGEYVVPVTFEAAADAPLGGKLVELSGASESSIPVVGRFHQEVVLTAGPGDAAFHAVNVSKVAVVVVEPGPIQVALIPPAVAAPVDGTLDVAVRVTRDKDYAVPVEVTFPVLPPGVEAPTSVVIPADKSESVVTLVIHPSAAVGDWKLAADVKPAAAGRAARDPLSVGMNGLGTPTGGGRRRRNTEGVLPVGSGLVELKVAEPPVKGVFAPTAGEQGKTVKIICTLDTPPKGRFTAKLDGLPPRATAQPMACTPDAKQIEFPVIIDPTTPPGKHSSLVCELTGEVGGQKVVYRLGRGGVLTVNAPGGVKLDATGKPLSPLDALRQAEKKDPPKQDLSQRP